MTHEGARSTIDPEFEAAVRAAFTAFNERRFEGFAAAVTEDLVEIYPQSGERLVGRDRQLAFHHAIPDPPTFHIRAVWRSGDLAVVETDETSANGERWKDCWILHLRDGKVAAMTGYFGMPFSPPEWRGAFMTVDED